MAVTAIVPLKSLASAKGRLSGVLSPADRQTFAAWMAQRVLAACASCAAIDDILLVAGDAAAAEVAHASGVPVLQVDEPGLQVALDTADAHIAGAAATVVVAADLPAVTPPEIADVVGRALAGSADRVVVAPTHDGGTGALARRPPLVMGTAYGPGSAQRHAQMATAAGALFELVHHPGLAHDVDTPAQLSAALARFAPDDVHSPARPSAPHEERACRKAP